MLKKMHFIENSIYLFEHQALKYFLDSVISKNKYEFSSYLGCIVCERREDIAPLKKQISLILKNNWNINYKENHQLLKIYSLDDLSKLFCFELWQQKIGNHNLQIPDFLKFPFLSYDEQLNYIKFILADFGYWNSDAAALAKQILSLIDIILPSDENLASLIVQTGETKVVKIDIQSQEFFLKQILATSQASKIFFTKYCRLQSLINKYISHEFKEDFENYSSLKWSDEFLFFLQSPTLWFGGMEFVKGNDSHKCLDYQYELICNFKESIKILKNNFLINKNQEQIFLESKTLIDNDFQINHNNINLFIYENDREFKNDIFNLIENKEVSKQFVWLAEFVMQDFKHLNNVASGQYVLSKDSIQLWKETGKSEFSKNVQEFYEKYELFINNLKSDNSIAEIASTYGIKPVLALSDGIYHLFSHAFQGKILDYNLDSKPYESLSRVLSFVPGSCLPNNTICLGYPHGPISYSLNIKILNRLFSFLRQKGLDVDLPFFDICYQKYWTHVFQKSSKGLEFWAHKLDDISLMPDELMTRVKLNLKKDQIEKINFSKTNEFFIHPNWQENTLFSEKKYISVTQFEDYVHCPQKFFLSHLLHIDDSNSQDKKIHMVCGIIIHKICENFLTDLLHIFGNDGYINETTTIFETLIQALSDEVLFLSENKQSWSSTLASSLSFISKDKKSKIDASIFHAIDEIWKADENFRYDKFLATKQREILKRSFLKFLSMEKALINQGNKIRVGVFREYPLHLNLGGVSFAGRLDRVDLSSNGLEIIDYKLSSPSKNNKKLNLFLPMDSNQKLSVQGALYSLALSNQVFSNGSEEYEDKHFHRISSYSMYYLKNIHMQEPHELSFKFDPVLEKGNSVFMQLEKCYTPLARNLALGQFSPLPLDGENTCMFCLHRSICPMWVSQNT